MQSDWPATLKEESSLFKTVFHGSIVGLQHKATQYSTTKRNAMQHNVIYHNTTQHNTTDTTHNATKSAGERKNEDTQKE